MAFYHQARPLRSDATVLADYALTTTTNHCVIIIIFTDIIVIISATLCTILYYVM